jgi:hypothetical protein
MSTTWRFLFEERLKIKETNAAADRSEVTIEASSVRSGMPIEQPEAYQKKLFENDLYVWSLLLLKNNDI